MVIENFTMHRLIFSLISDRQECGKSFSVGFRIFGGSLIERGQYPWMAAFFCKNRYCGGGSLSECNNLIQKSLGFQNLLILVTEKHVLTAAHCIQDFEERAPVDSKDCYFLLGKVNLAAEESGSFNATISELIPHWNWDPMVVRGEADIGIAVLRTKVEYSQYIKPICLFNENSNRLYGNFGTISGWGATEKNPKNTNDVALETDVEIAGVFKCLLKHAELLAISTETGLCGINGDGTGACIGKMSH